MVVFRFCLFLSIILLKYGSKGDADSLRLGDVDFQTVDLIAEYRRQGALQNRNGANLTLPLRSVLPAGLPSTFTITATFKTANIFTWCLVEVKSIYLLFSIKLIPEIGKMAIIFQQSRVLFSTPGLFEPLEPSWHKIHVTVTNDTVHAAVDCVELVPKGIREWDLSDATSITIVSDDYGMPAPVEYLKRLSLSYKRYNLIEDSCKEIGVEVPRKLPESPGTSGMSTSTTSDSILGLRGPKGETGQKGERGVRGYPGQKGSMGLMGLQGLQGPPGMPGSSNLMENHSPSISEDDVKNICDELIRERLEDLPSSFRGPRGFTGDRGRKGDMGDKGFPGRNGAPGVVVPRKLPESPGTSGMSTSTTSDSILGLRGPKGETGQKGERGVRGYPGQKGSMGLMGLQGLQGPPGMPGSSNLIENHSPSISEDDVRNICDELIRERLEKRLRGPQGFTGYKGEKGDRGLQGRNGAPGIPNYNDEPRPIVQSDLMFTSSLEGEGEKDSEEPSDMIDV